MSEANRRALDAAIDAAQAAGALLRRAFHRPDAPGDVAGKALADVEAERVIRDRLTRAFPTYGFRAEEDPTADRAPVSGSDGLWLVDPNDGTSSFQRGQRGASVSIGLIRDGRPVLGVVYGYASPDDDGDLLSWAEGCGPLRRNGALVEHPGWPMVLSAEDTILVSRSADRRAAHYAAALAPARYRPMPGIAYRLALAAAGEAVAAISLNAPRDFDIAAGHALLRAVGGELLDERGQPIRYRAERPTRAGFCFGGAPEICRTLLGLDWAHHLSGPRAEPEPYDLIEARPDALMADASRLRRGQGCWLGQLVGDALGSQVEFLDAKAIDARWPTGVNAMVDGGTHETIAGQPTDDSELARLLAWTLVARGAYDEDDAARAYAWWFRSRPFDMGHTTAAALSAIQDAHPAASARAAASRTSQANGALMRISPMGIAGHAWSERRLVELARADARLTHPHPTCQDANAALALAIAFALREGASADRVYTHTVAGAKALGLHPEVIGLLEAAAQGPPDDFIKHSGWVRIALQNAFYQLLYAEDFANGLMDTVAFGGDTDTNACIAGALLGAVHGRAAIPPLWIDRVITARPIAGLPGVVRVRPRGCWPIDALVLAERLMTLS